jgi:hypothetical protein
MDLTLLSQWTMLQLTPLASQQMPHTLSLLAQHLLVYQKGVGVTTIDAVTSGTTTIVSAGAVSAAPVLAQYKSAACIKVAANSWIVVGAIA